MLSFFFEIDDIYKRGGGFSGLSNSAIYYSVFMEKINFDDATQ
jgi:hypothetical protein